MSFLFRIDFEITHPQAPSPVNKNGDLLPGPYPFPDRCSDGHNVYVDQYRHGRRSALALAASSSPQDLMTPIANNVALQSGEQIQILAARQIELGTEGAAVLGSAAGAVFVATFQVRKLNQAPVPLGGAPLNLYSKPPRKAIVAAASAQGVPGVLAANIVLASGEALDVLNVEQYVGGGEAGQGTVWS